MPLPTYSDVHVNVPLTNIAESWLVREDQYIATRVFPVVPVQQASGKVVRYCRKDFFNAEIVRPRAPGAKSQGTGFHVDTDTTYNCMNYAHRWELPDRIRQAATSPINLERTGVGIIMQRLKLKMEILFAQAAFQTGIWGSQVTVGLPWNNANATPITDVRDAKLRMALATGFEPNTLVVNTQVFEYLRTHPTITAVYRNNAEPQPNLSASQVAAVLDIERLLVGRAVYDAGPMQGQWEGNFVFGNHALLCYTTSAPSLQEPSAGYVLGYVGGSSSGTVVKISQYRGEEDTNKDIFVGEFDIDTKVVEPDLGVFFPNVISGDDVLTEVVMDVDICE